MRRFIIVFVPAILFVLAFFCAIGGLLEFPLQLLLIVPFGWIIFLARTLPNASVEPAAIAVGAGSLAAIVFLLHFLSRGIHRQLHGKQPNFRPWRFRWSLALVFSVLSLFTAGICILVTIHETGWLLTSKEPIIQSASYEFARRANSANNLKKIGLGMHNYHDQHHIFPPGGTFNEYGEMQHSWETMLLPYMEYDTIKPDLKLPWNHRDNKEQFSTQIQEFLNPSVSDPKTTDVNGYALSHYSVNSHVLRDNYAVRKEDVTDGLQYTIMAGEATANFKPWGHPVNWRDPNLGLGKSPDGFGGSHPSVTEFLMMDGGVRGIRNDIDPDVLRALSTPAGGEPPRQEEW